MHSSVKSTISSTTATTPSLSPPSSGNPSAGQSSSSIRCFLCWRAADKQSVNHHCLRVMMRTQNILRNILSLSSLLQPPTSLVYSPRSGSGRLFDASGRFDDAFQSPPHFLESCFLSKNPLNSNRDIFMYREEIHRLVLKSVDKRKSILMMQKIVLEKWGLYGVKKKPFTAHGPLVAAALRLSIKGDPDGGSSQMLSAAMLAAAAFFRIPHRL